MADLTWLTDPTTHEVLKAADFWMGAIGFSITGATFGLGWYKVTKLQTEVAAVKSRFDNYDAIFEADELMGVHGRITSILDDQTIDWKMVASLMVDAKRAGAGIENVVRRSGNTEIAEQIRINAIKFEKIIVGIERAVLAGAALPDHVRIRRTIRLSHDSILDAQRKLRELIR